MAKASGVRAGKAYVELGADDAPLIARLRSAAARVKSWGKSLSDIGPKISEAGEPLKTFGGRLLGVGSAVAGSLLGASKAFADLGGDAADMAKRLGIGVEALSEFDYAAKLSGTDIATFEGAVAKMQKTIVAAANGSSKAQEALAGLGLDYRKLAAMEPEKQFLAVADALSKVGDPTKRAATAMAVFGKSGTALLPLVADGAEGIAKLRGEARDLGLTMKDDDVKASEAWGDALDVASRSARALAFTAGAALVPTLTEVVSAIVSGVKNVREWIDANRPLVDVAFRVALAVAGVGAAIVAVGGLIAGAGAVVGGFGSVLTAIGATLGAILSPVGLVVVAVAGLTTAFFRFTSAGAATADWLGSRFAALRADAAAAFAGIGDALAAGDITLAGEILWAALNIQFQKGINGLKDLWADWGTAVTEVYRGVVFGIAGLFVDGLAGIEAGFVNALGYLRDGWSGFVAFLQTTWNNFGGFFAKVWERIKALFSGKDVEAEIRRINDETAAKNRAVDASTGETVLARRKDREADLARIEAGRAATKATLGQDQTAETDNRRAEAAAGIAARAAELKAAQDELAALSKEAADKKAAKATADAGSKKPGPVIDPAAIDAGVSKAAKTAGVSGSFSATAIAGLGAGDSVADAIKDQTKEAKKTNEKLDKTNRLLEQAQALD